MNIVPFDAWISWFKTRCNHNADPSDWEVWNGAVETIAHYLRENISTIESLSPEMTVFLEKFISKFEVR